MSAFAFLAAVAAQVGGGEIFAILAAADLALQGWESDEVGVGAGVHGDPLKLGVDDVLVRHPGRRKGVWAPDVCARRGVRSCAVCGVCAVWGWGWLSGGCGCVGC